MKFFCLSLLLISYLQANAQHNNELYNDGALLHVQNGAEVHVWGDVHMIGGSLDNNGFIKTQGNSYSDNIFQQRSSGGTGIYRIENSDVNTTERQFIQGSYAVRGGQAQTTADDGAFEHLELGNSQGIVYLVADAKSVDTDGQFDYTPIVVANIKTTINGFNNDMISLFPNPSNGDFALSIHSNQSRELSVSIYNSLGQIIQNVNPAISSGNTVLKISSIEWAPGVYHVKVTNINTGQTVNKKFVKN